MDRKVAIVTGGSSGIGRCTAEALRDKGCVVYKFSRRRIPLTGEKHITADVTDESRVTAAVNTVLERKAGSIGFGCKCICVLRKVLPCGLRNWAVRLLYAR